MRNLKVAVIGSGSTYTPELVDGFLRRVDSLRVDSFYMMDIDAEKNAIVSALAERMVRAKATGARVVVTDSLEEAVEGADYVLGQVRVGKLDARIKDEKIPLRYGMLGQETTGAGGFLKALRTIPVMLNVARTMERLAPRAWLINFSNPSGIVAQALLNHSDIQMMGLCNNAINMQRAVRAHLPQGAAFDYGYVGLNHLSWMTAAYADGVDKLPALRYDEALRHVNGLRYPDALLDAIGALPCGYLSYFYLRQQMYDLVASAEKSRGEVCKEIEKELLALYSDPTLTVKPAALDKRGGAMYSEAAASLINALENDLRETHVVNVRNQGALSFMAPDDVVELKCVVGKDGAAPIAMPGFQNDHIVGLMQAVKRYERLTVEAGLTGSRDAALAALLCHPLVGDYDKAKPMLDELLEAHRAFLPQFFPA